MVFLDTNPVIYFVEQPPTWGVKASARVAAVRMLGEQLAVSDLVRMECIVGPLRTGDAAKLADFQSFFTAPDVIVLSITGAVCDRAAQIRAQHGFKPLDSLHLAAAVENGCTHFITNDASLKGFPDILIELLT
ncbi:MAG TPA: PIN domain-containing protein [Pirellulales bacterium]|nr:PIN domain-containing protein [Pirellulales bacterium]